MVHPFVTIIFIGESFEPEVLQNLAAFDLKNIQRKGDIGSIGKYRNKKIPYGSAQVTFYGYDKEKVFDFSEILIKLKENHNAIMNSKVDDIMLTLNLEYEHQCNWEFDNLDLKTITETRH